MSRKASKCISPNTTFTRNSKETTIKAPELIKKIQKAIEDKKGRDIRLFDVRKISTVTDYYIVVSASSAPHLRAIADEIQYSLKKEGTNAYRRSGDPESGWVVVDFFDVVIHIFEDQKRQYYAIEELWAGARRPRR